MTKFNHFKEVTLVVRTRGQKRKSKRTDEALANLKRSVRDLRIFKKPRKAILVWMAGTIEEFLNKIR